MYGHVRSTAPFLAELATRSTLFTRCYSAATYTRPAVTSILSGLPSLEHRGWGYDRGFPANRPSFVQRLGQAGYHPGFFTANPAIGEGFGIKEHFDHVDYGAASAYDFGPRLTDDCADWVTSLDGHRPAFVYIHYWPPHGPYEPPAEFVEQARTRPRPGDQYLPHRYRGGAEISLGAFGLGRIPWYQAKAHLSTDLIDYLQRYEASIAYADWLAAGFFSRWKRLRGGRRTVSLVTGDHGEAIGEHGLLCNHGKLLIDEILHVPLVVHDTARPVASTVERPVSHLDLGITILEMAGIPQRIGRSGESLTTGGPAERVIVSQEALEVGESGWALTSGRWRLVYNPGARFGGGHIMEVRSGDALPRTVTGTPLPLSPVELRGPTQIGMGATLSSFALHAPVLIPGANVGFSGTLQVSDADGRLALRARLAGGRPVSLGFHPEGDFSGEFWIPDGGPADLVIVEGSFQRKADPAPPESTWYRLLTVPLGSRRDLGEGLEIMQAMIHSSPACPGDAVQISLRWAARRILRKQVGVLVELVGSDGNVVLRETRNFFRHFPDPKAEPRPVPDDKKVGKTTFSGASLDLEDSFWWTLPTSVAPGDYQLNVGLLDYSRLFAEARIVSLGESVPVETLAIRATRAESLRFHNHHELGIENLRVPRGFQPRPADRRVIEALANRYPGEGHLEFLLAQVARSELERRERLVRCLERTPFHRSALAELASLGDKSSATLLERLTPSHRTAANFGDVVRLFGFDLCHGESCVYLTLFWEAEAVSGQLFAAKLAASMRQTEGGALTNRWIWWFIGGETRPTCTWKMGETVVETVRLDIEPGITDLSLEVRVAEQWSALKSGGHGPFLITAGNAGKMQPVTALLGTHRLQELPRCETDYLALKRADPGQCVLFDLEEDPEQHRDLTRKRPDVFARLHHQLGALLTASDSRGRRQEGTEVELSPETVEQLKALGYLE